MGEFELIRRFFTRARGAGPQRALLGVGDDCALLDIGGTLAISTDMLIEGRHFFADVDPAALGHKSLAVNLSDLAAMGAEPLAFTLSIALPQARADDATWLDRYAQGLFALGDRHGCELIGGDTTAGPLVISIAILGRVEAEQALRRSGARAGDDVYVSGTLGDAALALGAMRGTLALGVQGLAAARERLERPQPRVALGRALRGIASSAIDLSDGMAGDLRHILAASGVGAEIDVERVPVSSVLAAQPRDLCIACALAGGDDYELCFTAPPAHAEAVMRLARAVDVPVTRIGRIVPGATLQWMWAGRPFALDARGFDHFASP